MAEGKLQLLVDRDVEVPMRDGVVLRADVYRPAAAGRYPVLLHRTAYNKGAISPPLVPANGPVQLDPVRAASNGYAVVIQDERGRYASDGEPLEVIGPVRAVLYAASDAVDTDFTAKLVDVHPDGFAQNLCEGIVRARFRDSANEPKLQQPGAVTRYEIDLWATANRFARGHKIRLEIASSSFPKWDRNFNVATEPALATEGVVARQTVFHDAERPSHVVLPVVPAVAG